MNSDQESKLQKLLSEIVELHPALSEQQTKFREEIVRFEKLISDTALRTSGEYWRLVAYADAVIRLRLMLEQNFKFVETMGILAVTRYIFEMLVWLRVLSLDSRYGLTYCLQLMEKQIRYHEDLTAKMERDVALLKQLGEEEGKRFQALAKENLGSIDESSTDKIAKLIKEIESESDRKARRNFCLHADQAKTNGHTFQAFLVENQLLPKLQARLDQLRREHSQLLANIPDRPPVGKGWERQEKAWKWKDKAAIVGMSEQFEFIYSFTSRLLHATPVSLTTNQKLLEPDEMCMFLEYIYVSILDVVDLSQSLLDSTIRESGVH